MDPAAFEQATQSPDAILVDVRTPEEYAQGHIEGAINIDVRKDTFANEIGKMDRNKTILIYCRSGNRTRTAGQILEQLNFKKYDYLKGGVTQWKNEGKPATAPEP